MADLMTEHEVKTVLRKVFAAGAGISDPTDIVDSSNLYDPPPPAGDLGFAPPPAAPMASMLTLAARELLGAKAVAKFATFLLPPDLPIFTTFGTLAISIAARFNLLANRAVFLAICKALGREPSSVSLETAIASPNEAGARAFARELESEIRTQICNKTTFKFSKRQEQQVMADTTVSELRDLVIEILSKKACI